MKSFPRWLIVVSGLAMLALIGGGYWFYGYQKQDIRQNSEANLQAIVQLKVNLIASWRAERLGDAAVLMESPLLIETLVRWMADPEPKATGQILTQLRAIREHYHYGDALLVDVTGRIRLSLSGRTGSLRDDLEPALTAAFRERRPIFTDLEVDRADLSPSIDVVVPFFAKTGKTPAPTGAIVLKIDARQFLYPLMQLWPTPSLSAETLLVRRDGDAVLFLNELRHQQDTALKLRIPLSTKEVPAVMAVLGKEGIVQGQDYRGVDVLSVLKAVPNSPWFMIAKVDEAEALSDWRFRSMLIPALVIGLLALVVTAVGMAWHKNGKVHYKELFLAEATLRRAEEGHRITLMSVGDGIISTDTDGRVEVLNPVAEVLTGWRQEEARGKSLEDVFRIFNEETRRSVENPVSKVLREGLVVGLANHTILVSQDGTERPIADSAAPIRGEDGEITGVVLAFRNQSKERAAQRELTKQYEELQETHRRASFLADLIEKSSQPLAVGYPDGRVETANEAFCRLTGYSRDEFAALDWASVLTPPEWREIETSKLEELNRTGQPVRYEKEYVRKDGNRVPVELLVHSVRGESDAPQRYYAFINDITERKRAEQRIEHLNRVLRSIREVNQLIVREKNLDRLIQEACKLLVDNQGYGSALLILSDEAGVPRSFAEAGAGDVFQPLAEELNHGKLPPCCEETRFQEGVYLVTDRSRVCALCPLATACPSGHSMCIRLRHEERTYGYLAVSAPRGIVHDEEELSLLAELADDIGFALRSIELTEQASRSSEDLRRSEEKYRNLVETINDVIYEIDNEGVISYLSPVVRNVLGYEPEEIIGKTFEEFVYAEDRGVVKKRFEHLMEGVEHLTECRVVGKSGELRWIQTLARPTRKGTGVAGARGAFIDITERKRAEQDLHESEERFRLAFENANVGVCLVDGEGRFLRVNEQLSKILGYSRGELETMNVNDLTIPDDQQITADFIQKALTEQITNGEFEKRYFHKQGQIVHCRIASSVVPDAQGTPLYFICHVQDITERKRAEEALQKRVIALTQPLDDAGVIQLSDLFDVAELQGIQDAFADATGVASIITAPDGTPITQPSNFCRLCSEIVRQTEKGLINCFKFDAEIGRHNPSGPIVQACLSGGLWVAGASISVGGRHLANWLIGQVRNEELDETRMLEYAHEIGADSEEFSKALAEVPVMSKEQFEKVSRSLFRFANELSMKAYQNVQQARFIADRQKAEALRIRLVTAIEQAAEGVVITDADGTIQYVNPALEKMTGHDSEELVGKNPRVLKSGEQGHAFYQHLWETIKQGQVWTGRFVNKRKDGGRYHADATISPVRDDSGKIVNFVAVQRDITEHLELSRQLQQAQKMEAVGTLAGGVAHDFNNLLQVVLGYSDLVLADDDLPDQFRNDLEKILLAGRNGADLVRRLLTFSRKSEPKPLDLDLNQRIRQTRKLLKRTVPKMIDIDLVLAEDLAGIHADPTQIDQVLMNLAVNARDAMPGGGTLVIETANVVLDDEYARSHLEAEPGRYVLLQVSDTGSGMDRETLEHIFEPFYTTKGPGEGTGLGLAMVFGIVKQHHGFINCYSEAGHGSAFKIYLPAVRSETQSDQPVVTAIPQGGTETILLVDDEELIRDLGKRVLRKAGYTVLTASNGKEALELYRKEQSRIALVILDLIMPEMGGKECLERLLEINPTMKALIASGYSADGPIKGVSATGSKGFVAKPFDVRQVLELIRKALDEE
jgi:PAS domain S-box-containing protein